MNRRARRRVAAAVLPALLLHATTAWAEVARRGNVVMGTVLTVTVVAGTGASADELAQAALDEAARWDDALTIWRDDGELARLNAAAGRGARDVSARLASSLAAMLDLAAATGGAFDPATGSLPDEGRRGRLAPLSAALRVDGSKATLGAGTRLDPGAIGKGLALDAITGLWRRGKVGAAFADFGGSSQAAVGAPPGDAAGWSVLVAGLAAGTAHGVLKLKDSTLSTSRAGAVDTKPILDPRSGLPVPGPRLATVLAPSAAASDAWSTALVVDGRAGIDRAVRAGLDVLVEDGQGVSRSDGFRLEPPPAPATGPGQDPH